jgi:secreted trypsin-like serine protease
MGGEPANIKEFPHSASIRKFKNKIHICGGSIITNKHILTAAHCFDDQKISRLRVYIGKTKFKITTQDNFGIENCEIHPRYTGVIDVDSVLRFDIAVLTVL